MKIILVVGLTGAGKTTYCKKIASTENAHVFSIDHWMKSLYWQDMPANLDKKWFQENFAWYIDRISRCESLIREQIQSLCATNTSIILDLGFTAKAHRKVYLDLARDLSCDSEIHFLDVPQAERWKRVEERNQSKGETYAMVVSREMFDYVESVFELISEDEKELCTGIIYGQ